MSVDPAIVKALEEPLGPQFKVEPFSEGGYRVTHKRSGLAIETRRDQTLACAATVLIGLVYELENPEDTGYCPLCGDRTIACLCGL